MPTATMTRSDFISAEEARSILGLNTEQLVRMARLGHITVQRLPTVMPRYSRADCERLAADSIVYARPRKAQ